jgi:hypothetical protein
MGLLKFKLAFNIYRGRIPLRDSQGALALHLIAAMAFSAGT